MLWTAQDAAAATGGTNTCDWAANGVSIDTRTLQKGDLFIALSAARDGHDFVATALENGAAAALVTHRPQGVAKDAPLLIVPDVLAALAALGRAARTRSRAKVVAITGSVGKTSTKDMLRLMLSPQGKTHVAEASYNNHWGVPLTLARMPADADFAVIEIGMSAPGEIAPLAQMTAPDVAMITTVAPAHLQAFASVEAIAHEKAAIFTGLRTGGAAIINADLPTTPILLGKAQGAQIIRFGHAADAEYRLTESPRLSNTATVIRAQAQGAPLLFKIAAVGEHFAQNALGALAAAAALGADQMIAAQDLGEWTPPDGRGARIHITLDQVESRGFDLIDDAFNANPASMAASLSTLAALTPPDPRGGRVAILGDMLELGPEEAALHAAIAQHPALAHIRKVHCIGPRMRALYDALDSNKRVLWHANAEDAAAHARHLISAGDLVMVKGSKGSYVSKIVTALRRLEHNLAEKGAR